MRPPAPPCVVTLALGAPRPPSRNVAAHLGCRERLLLLSRRSRVALDQARQAETRNGDTQPAQVVTAIGRRARPTVPRRSFVTQWVPPRLIPRAEWTARLRRRRLVARSLGTLPLPVVVAAEGPTQRRFPSSPLCLELGAAAHVRAAHTDCRAQLADGYRAKVIGRPVRGYYPMDKELVGTGSCTFRASRGSTSQPEVDTSARPRRPCASDREQTAGRFTENESALG